MVLMCSLKRRGALVWKREEGVMGEARHEADGLERVLGPGVALGISSGLRNTSVHSLSASDPRGISSGAAQ